MDMRRSWSQITLLILALVGVGISIYLTIVHYQNISPVCSVLGIFNCELVLTSKFSLVPGTSLPISVPGLLWSVAFALLALIGWRNWSEQRTLLVVECILAILGMLAALYLVYAELVVLHAFCAWCTALHIIIFAMLIISTIQLTQTAPQPEDDEVEEEQPSVTTNRK